MASGSPLALAAPAVAASHAAASFSVAVTCNASANVSVSASERGAIAASSVVHVGANGSAILGVYSPAARRSIDLDPRALPLTTRTEPGSVSVEVRLDAASLREAANASGEPDAAGDLVVVASAT